MEIKTEKKVTKDNKEVYEIKDIKGVLSRGRLPLKYLEGKPCFYLNDQWSRCVLEKSTEGTTIVDLGKKFIKECWLETLEDIKEAGERLHLINSKRRETEKNWKGEETFII